ncbi:MAG: pentapeptide repeat-containing protein [Desulfobulbus sp.]|nr:pentapeptide repeat-containing protein [Desulfobulbus sp.]
MSGADFRGANFGGANLWGFLYEAILTSVDDLHQANRRIKDFTRTGCKYTHKVNSLWGSARTFPKATPGNGFDIAISPQEANQHTDHEAVLDLLAA